MKNLLSFYVMLLIIESTLGQVKTNFNNHEEVTVKGKFQKNFSAKIHRNIPPKDIPSLLAKEASESRPGEAKPFRIAQAEKVDIDVVKEADWVNEGSFAFGKFTLVATGAKSISANFDQFYLPKGSELWVYNEKGEMITGPVTESENNTNNFWGTWVYKGEKLTIDLKIPIASKSSLMLHISNVAYGYKEIYVTNFGESASCNVNVMCPAEAAWQNEANSVSLILDANSIALCSGALINNSCNINIPYLLTANHCFNTSPQQDVSKWKFTFQAYSPTCAPSQNVNGVTFNGSTLKANNAGSDFCLVQLNQDPPVNSGITFSGWSRSGNAPPSGVSITHPEGDVMKIATYNTAPTQQMFLGSNDWNVVWAAGTVQPGSSGGPLYDNNHRIIGQVHGGNPQTICNPGDNAFFGRFDLSWTGGGTNSTRLSNWLDPFNSGAMTTNTINIANTVADYRNVGISGPSLVCTTGQYSPTNLPAGIGLTFSSSNPSGLSINSSTGAATRVNNFNGQVTVTATVSGGGCVTSVSKMVSVGNYFPTGSSSYNSNCSGNIFTVLNTSLSAACSANTPINFSYHITDPNYSNFVFTPVSVPAGATWSFSGGSLHVTVTTPSSQGSRSATIALNATGPCGPYSVNFTSTAVNYSSPFFSISPNPSAETVTVTMDENSADELSQNLMYAIKITDQAGTVGRSFEYKAGVNSVKISLQDFNPGLYLLSVFDGKMWSSERLIVQK
ncbi:MAG: T9SS type A sorting domain-containing protein [Bacteroidetes bacterium]|nr:T9SS type A sorting domain-containing protein [Bacteroidota bacterium]